jgi:hypothetical protein
MLIFRLMVTVACTIDAINDASMSINDAYEGV